MDKLRDRLSQGLAWAVALGLAAVFIGLLADLVGHGLSRLSWSFLVESPTDSGRAGGILPMLASTGLILLVCMAVAVPLGLGTAVLLAEYTRAEGRWGALIRRSLDVLAGVPSIVFGLFGAALFCSALGLGFSILAGGLTLACMVLPILIRATEAGLRAVPDAHRRAGAALGLSRAALLWHVILPAATPGLVAGLVLGVGRALAETAALLFTSGYVDRMPGSVFDSGRSLSIHIFDLSMNVPGGTANAAATALVLVGLLLLINAAVAWGTHRLLAARLAR